VQLLLDSRAAEARYGWSLAIHYEVIHVAKGRFRPGELDRGAERDEHVIHRRERCRQPCEVDLVNLQLCTGLDVRRRSAQQGVHAAVMLCSHQFTLRRAARRPEMRVCILYSFLRAPPHGTSWDAGP
jgi:hypothetical protein